ncbi:protein of unknown function [Methylococcus capsulatus]|uniref:Uncharacterized protein n=1 Tax=Methylococcus capsulatus TaxID=414 RepID=A0AA35UKD7_METCP|nr:protein of unknown function [Methylococcus capsulatus]
MGDLLGRRRAVPLSARPGRHRPHGGDDALGAVAHRGAAPSRLDARRGTRVAGDLPALRLRPHYGLAAVAEGARHRRLPSERADPPERGQPFMSEVAGRFQSDPSHAGGCGTMPVSSHFGRATLHPFLR